MNTTILHQRRDHARQAQKGKEQFSDMSDSALQARSQELTAKLKQTAISP